MKNYRFVLVMVLVALVSIPCFAKRHIHLDGQAKQAGCPIEASIEEATKELILEFTENVGTIEIAVINSNGVTVCTEIAEGTDAGMYILNLDTVSNGTYTLLITTNNRRFFGQFEIE